MISLLKIRGPSFLRVFFLAVLCTILSGCEPPRPVTVDKTVVDKLLLLDATRASQRIVAVGDYGYVVTSDDDGTTWRSAKSPVQSTLTAVAFADDRHGWIVGHDAVILRSTDGGETWEQTYSAPDKEAPLLNLWFENSEHGYAFGAYGTFYETSDGGKTWNSRKVLETDGHIYAMARTGAGQLFLAGEAGTLYRSRDNGETWQALVAPYRGSYFGALGLPDGGILIFGLRGHAFRSHDGGDTWTSVDTGTEVSLMGGEVLANGSIVLLGGEGVILISRDSAKAFTRLKHPENKTLIAAVTVGENKILAFGEPGALKARISLNPATSALQSQ